MTAVPDPVDPPNWNHLFADFLYWVKAQLDEDALEHPIERDDIDRVLNRCDHWIEVYDL